MSKLKELEKRLRDEPDNLGLRVVVAGALHEAGRRDDAVQLYRSVAVAYRDQGRPQQAITVCRSILELAPDDATSQELLAALLATQAAPRESPMPARLSPPPSVRPSPQPQLRPSPQPPSRLPRPPSPAEVGEPRRRSSGDVTPLPPPLPYHVADPTSGSQQKLLRTDLPPSLQEELALHSEIAGIASAARAISASLIAASPPDEDDDISIELDTRRRPRVAVDELDKISAPPPTAPVDRVGDGDGGDVGDDDPTLPPRVGAAPRARGEDETTEPRDQPTRTRPPSIAPPTAATGPLAGAFFAPVPPHNRAGVLQRFRRRMAAAGMTVIRRGETGHGLVVVVRGQLELRLDRGDGTGLAFAVIAPGDYVGETSLLARAPAPATVVAVTESEILVLAATDFYEVAGAFPALWAELKSVAERRTRELEQHL